MCMLKPCKPWNFYVVTTCNSVAVAVVVVAAAESAGVGDILIRLIRSNC